MRIKHENYKSFPMKFDGPCQECNEQIKMGDQVIQYYERSHEKQYLCRKCHIKILRKLCGDYYV